MDALELVATLRDGSAADIARVVASDTFLKACNTPLPNGQYALHALACKGSAKGVAALLHEGVNVNQESEEQGNNLGFTAVHYAAATNCVPVLEVLKAHGANLDHPAADQWTPLHVATFRGQSDAVQKLVELGANIDCVNGEGHTPLLFAVNLGRVKDARFLLRSNASIQLTDATEDNLLHYALHYRMAQQLKGQYRLPESQLDVAVLLVLNGVRPDQPNAEGDLPTRYAEATLPSLPRALSVLFDNAIQLLCAPMELNYLTLVTASEAVFADTVGLAPEQAKEVVGAMHAVEAERQSLRKKNTPSPPTVSAAAGLASEAHAMPSGHPTVPKEYMSMQGGDPSNGKCPFLARAAKQQANIRGGSSDDGAVAHCPFSWYSIRNNKTTVIMVGVAFAVGYACGQSRRS